METETEKNYMIIKQKDRDIRKYEFQNEIGVTRKTYKGDIKTFEEKIAKLLSIYISDLD